MAAGAGAGAAAMRGGCGMANSATYATQCQPTHLSTLIYSACREELLLNVRCSSAHKILQDRQGLVCTILNGLHECEILGSRPSRKAACGAGHRAGQGSLCAYMDDAVMTSTIAVAASTGTQFPLMSHLFGRLYSLCSTAWLLLLLLPLLAAAGARRAGSALL